MDVGEDGGPPGIVPDQVTGLIDEKQLQVPAPDKPKRLTEEQKLKAFFDDPEKSIKVFMTSYSRSMGYIWYQKFCIQIITITKQKQLQGECQSRVHSSRTLLFCQLLASKQGPS